MPADLTPTGEPTVTPGPTTTADHPAAPPGFELQDAIGHGGMGAVYRAHDRALGRDVAVKVLLGRYASDSAAARRFLHEARVTGQLQHPGIRPSTRSAPFPTAGLSWP
jgi:serine/threonine protein kinase